MSDDELSKRRKGLAPGDESAPASASSLRLFTHAPARGGQEVGTILEHGCACFHAPEQHLDNRTHDGWGWCSMHGCDCRGWYPDLRAQLAAVTERAEWADDMCRRALFRVASLEAAEAQGPPWLADAAEALGELRPDGAARALNWNQVLESIRDLRGGRGAQLAAVTAERDRLYYALTTIADGVTICIRDCGAPKCIAARALAGKGE